MSWSRRPGRPAKGRPAGVWAPLIATEATACRYGRRITTQLFTTTPTIALAVYAHPDDPEISCGGALASWAGRGSAVHVLVCTRGEKGTSDPDADLELLAQRRLGEMAEAGRALQLAGREQLLVDDGELGACDTLRADMVAAIRRIRPQVVLCPDPTAVFFGDSYYNHADHRVVGWACLDAVAPAAANPHYFPEAGPPHQVETVLMSGTLVPDVWVDVSAGLDAKIGAVLCHRSQLTDVAPERPPADHPGGSPDWFADVLRRRAADAGRQAGVAYAEGFRRLLLSSNG